MKLEEMKAIAKKRIPGEWSAKMLKEYFRECLPAQNQNPFAYDEDAAFIAMAANNWDKLMAVVEIAKAINEKRSEEEITDYPLENFFDLHKALYDLEKE